MKRRDMRDGSPEQLDLSGPFLLHRCVTVARQLRHRLRFFLLALRSGSFPVTLLGTAQSLGSAVFSFRCYAVTSNTTRRYIIAAQ